MLGRKERDQLELFISGSLRQLVPDDYILARVDRVLDLAWLRDEVTDLYCADNGRPGIDPEAAVRLMLAGFLLGLVHDRRLMREAQVNLAIRWFVGYGLHEALPDHSSLTRIRQRWGAERFRRIFERTVKACIAAKIATGEIVHIDASLIRADVSWESLVQRHADEVDRAHKHGRFFTARVHDCRSCPLAAQCLSKGRTARAVMISTDYPALLRARRRRDRWSAEDQRLYRRHRWRSEGFHGEAKTWHGLARAVRRGISNMKIQAYLTAAAINLKRLAAALFALILTFAALPDRLPSIQEANAA